MNLRKCTRFGAVAIRCWRSSRKHLYRHRRADAFRGHVVSCMRQSASCSAIKEVSNAMSRTQRGSGTTSNFARRRFGHLQFGSRQGLRMPQATTATTTTADGLGLGLWSLHLKIHGYTARARACSGKSQVSMVKDVIGSAGAQLTQCRNVPLSSHSQSQSRPSPGNGASKCNCQTRPRSSKLRGSEIPLLSEAGLWQWRNTRG